MRWIRILPIVAAVSMTAPLSPARGQEQPSAEALAAAQELFSLLFEGAVAALNAQAVEYAWPGIEASLREKVPSISAATLAALRAEYQHIRLAHMREAMKDMPALYARHLAAGEIRDITAFYRTPAGSRMLQAIPHVFTEGFAVVLPRMPAVASDTHEIFVGRLRERGLLK
jgi:uncharacterized protein